MLQAQSTESTIGIQVQQKRSTLLRNCTDREATCMASATLIPTIVFHVVQNSSYRMSHLSRLQCTLRMHRKKSFDAAEKADPTGPKAKSTKTTSGEASGCLQNTAPGIQICNQIGKVDISRLYGLAERIVSSSSWHRASRNLGKCRIHPCTNALFHISSGSQGEIRSMSLAHCLNDSFSTNLTAKLRDQYISNDVKVNQRC